MTANGYLNALVQADKTSVQESYIKNTSTRAEDLLELVRNNHLDEKKIQEALFLINTHRGPPEQLEFAKGLNMQLYTTAEGVKKCKYIYVS
jgi:hypothetical protein